MEVYNPGNALYNIQQCEGHWNLYMEGSIV